MTENQQRDAGTAWLAEICDASTMRPLLANPWTVEVEGEAWTIATNGHTLVGLRGGFGYPAPPSVDDAAKLCGVMFKEVAAEPVSVDLVALRHFVGSDVPDDAPLPDCATCKNTGAVKCQGCDGEGGEECECSCGNVHTSACSECHDEGEVDCPDCERAKPELVNKGRIFGHLFNREILVIPLRHLSGESATWLAADKAGIHRLDGDGWRLIVMPLRDDDSPPTDAPEFTSPKSAVEVPA